MYDVAACVSEEEARSVGAIALGTPLGGEGPQRLCGNPMGVAYFGVRTSRVRLACLSRMLVVRERRSSSMSQFFPSAAQHLQS